MSDISFTETRGGIAAVKLDKFYSAERSVSQINLSSAKRRPLNRKKILKDEYEQELDQSFQKIAHKGKDPPFFKRVN